MKPYKTFRRYSTVTRGLCLSFVALYGVACDPDQFVSMGSNDDTGGAGAGADTDAGGGSGSTDTAAPSSGGSSNVSCGGTVGAGGSTASTGATTTNGTGGRSFHIPLKI